MKEKQSEKKKKSESSDCTQDSSRGVNATIGVSSVNENVGVNQMD